jgi:hypothetical protein
MLTIPALCTQIVKNYEMDPFTEEGKRRLHILCYYAYAFSLVFEETFEDTVVIAKKEGPHIPAVEEWCNSLTQCVK